MDHLRHLAKIDRKLMVCAQEGLQIIRPIVQIYPNYGTMINAVTQRLQNLQRELGQRINVSENEIRANMSSQSLPLDPANFNQWRENRIADYIEVPCRPMARRILDSDNQPINSNAFRTQPKGPDFEYGLKGVWWQNPLQIENKFYTSLITGRTHAIDGAGDYSAPVEVNIDFKDCLAGDEYYQSLGIEFPALPKRTPHGRRPGPELG